MKLEHFKKNKKYRKILLTLGAIVLMGGGGIILYRSFALYQEEKTYNVLRGIIPDFSKSDIAITYTIEGKESTESFPVKTSGYTGVATCESGVEASWDNEEWGLSIINSNNQSNIICNIDFSEFETLVEYITNLATTSEEIVDDETSDHNLRYIGKRPNNYVQFNGELWQIIGVMNDVADENGKVEPRIKLIRRTGIGSYSWDNKGADGSSDWTVSAIKEVLNNGAYYNRTSGECPSGRNGATIACDFSNTGLTEESKKMISKIKWRLGGAPSNGDVVTAKLYELERGTKVYSGRPTEWIGEVGLVYSSDYGYATAGGDTTWRNMCLDTSFVRWQLDGYSDCKANDWLFYIGWSITPSYSNDSGIFNLSSSGSFSYASVVSKLYTYPVVYLNTNTKIVGGIGTESDPYILKV